MKEAQFYTKKPNKSVYCFLCHHRCGISLGDSGACSVRKNIDGVLYSLNYGEVVAINVDPIEKKPLFHFLPGSLIYSVACLGCNLKCDFCQNWDISQFKQAQALRVNTFDVSPEEVITQALEKKCRSIAYTYTEPTVFFEFAFQCAKIARKHDIYNTFVTNGYMSKEALDILLPYLDAANVDLKSFNEEFYRKYCQAELQPVLDNITKMRQSGVWVEVTTLVIPGRNDSDEELAKIAKFIASLDPNIPWHISRFHPNFQFMQSQPTGLSVLERAYKIGKEAGLAFIYIGNIHTDYAENTYCASCQKLVVERQGFKVVANNIRDSKCSFCSQVVKGVWQ